MAQTLGLKIKGLITNPNNLNDNVVDGALAYADNIVISKDNIAESRRGFRRFNEYLELGSIEGVIGNIFSYQSTIIAQHGSVLSRDNGVGAWVDFSGTFDSPSAYKMRSIEESQNLYVASNLGVKKLDLITSEFYDSGVVSSLDGFGSVSGTTGWFTAGTAVAYRMVWTRTDANENLIIGAPSSRVVVANTSGSASNVTLTFLVPATITTDYTYQIYRSNLTELITDEPTDELQLVLEGSPTSAEITAKEFILLDNVSETLKGAFLYTSPSQEGIVNSNYEPPLCKDMCSYKNHVFFANTATKHTYNLTLLGTGTDGFAIDDNITIAGVTYTAKAAEDSAAGEFELFNTGSPAYDIEATSLSLVKVINKYASNTLVYAYYLSGYDDLPGKLMFQTRTLGGDIFYVTSSNGNPWTPTLPASGTTEASTNDVKINRVFISKDHQPESVPLLNYLDIGSANKAILRVLALRESIFVFKEDGIYKISGESISNFRSTLHDNTTEILAPDSAVTFNNTVFCMSLQGVISVSEAGVAVVSRNIEQELLELTQFENFATTTFAVSYESERSYILFCVNANTHSYPVQAYVFNSFTQTWVRWTYNATCGLVSPVNDKLYLGGKEAGYEQYWVFEERKSFTVQDFVDENYGVTIVSDSGTETATGYRYLVLNSVENAVVGYWLVQTDAATGELAIGEIKSVTVFSNTITVNVTSERAFDTNPSNSVNIFKPITCRAKYVLNTAGNPGIVKQFREAVFFFRNDTAAEIDIGYETSLRPGYLSTESRTYNIGLWGQNNWGIQPWGGVDDTYIQPLRVGIPRNKQRCIGISFSVKCSNAFSPFALAGVSAQFEIISERIPYRGRVAGNG